MRIFHHSQNKNLTHTRPHHRHHHSFPDMLQTKPHWCIPASLDKQTLFISCYAMYQTAGEIEKKPLSLISRQIPDLACTRFEKINNHSLFDLFKHQCMVSKRTVVCFKNRVEKRIEVILQCSNLLVFLFQLQFEQLRSMAAAR